MQQCENYENLSVVKLTPCGFVKLTQTSLEIDNITLFMCTQSHAVQMESKIISAICLMQIFK